MLIGRDRTLNTLLVTKNKSPFCALARTGLARLLYAADRLTTGRGNEFLLKKALERVHTCAIFKLGFPSVRQMVQPSEGYLRRKMPGNLTSKMRCERAVMGMMPIATTLKVK